jgi:hypothetical protein
MSKETAIQAQDRLLAELAIPQKLAAWNALSQTIVLPTHMAAAILTGRPELLKAAGPVTTPLSADQLGQLYTALAVLIETNMALQQHAQQLANYVTIWAQAFKQLESLGRRIEQFAQFKPADSVDDDDEN